MATPDHPTKIEARLGGGPLGRHADHIDHHVDVDTGAGDRLRRAGAALRAGAAPPKADGVLVADLIDAFMRGEGSTLIGSRLPKQTAQRYERLRRRDELVRLAVAKFYSEIKSNRAQAKKLADALSRYRSSAWRRDRSNPECPAQYADKLRALLFQILKCVDAPLSTDRIRKLLG
jgi:hypothetical protein